MFTIDKNVSQPNGRTRYPFDQMEEGDSILFKDFGQAKSARVAALRFVRRYRPSWAFTVRSVPSEGGWRLWRTE